MRRSPASSRFVRGGEIRSDDLADRCDAMRPKGFAVMIKRMGIVNCIEARKDE